MKRHDRMGKWLCGTLTTAMLAANLSASLFPVTALAQTGFVNSGPGVAAASAQTAAVQTAADENILPADSPYKAVPIATNQDLLVDIGNWNKAAIKGITFEVGCTTDWNGGGGGGIFINNWGNTINFSFNSTKERVFCMFLPEEVERLRQTLKLNMWWTWSEADGSNHLKEVYIKPESVRLIVDKDAQPLTQPTGMACLGIVSGSGGSGGSGGGGGGSGSGGGGGSSSGGGGGSTGTTTVGKLDVDYKYIVRQRGTVVTIPVKDIYPEYQLGDILEITMSTKGGGRWNNFELSCYQGDEKIVVKKPGDNGLTSITMTANPNGGNIDVTVNWLDSGYMLYGFTVKKVGEGTPYADETLAEFKHDDIVANPTPDAPYNYQLDLSEQIREAAKKAAADGLDLSKKVTVRIKLDIASCYTYSRLDMKTGGESASSGSVAPDGGTFRGEAVITGYLSELSNLYWTFMASEKYPLSDGTVAKVKAITVEKPDPYKTSFTSADAVKVDGTDSDYEMDLSNLFQKAIREQLGSVEEDEELEVTVKLKETGWTWNKLQLAAVDGTKESDTLKPAGTFTAVVKGAPTAAQNLKLRFMYAGSMDAIGAVDVESITVKKTGNVIDGSSQTTFTKDDAVQGTDSNQYWTIDFTKKLKKALKDAGLAAGDKVKVTVDLTEENTWAWSQLELATAEGTQTSSKMTTAGNYQWELTGTLTDAPTLKMVFMNSDGGSIGTVKVNSIKVEKDETPVDPVPDTALKTIDYDEWNSTTTNEYNIKTFDITDLMKSKLPQDLAAGDEITITAEIDTNTSGFWWQIVGGIIADAETTSKSNTGGAPYIWKGKYSGSVNWAQLQLGSSGMSEGQYVSITDLKIEKAGEDIGGDEPVLAIDYQKWSEVTANSGVKGFDIGDTLRAALPSDVADGDAITISAEIDGKDIYFWQLSGDIIKNETAKSSATTASYTWSGEYNSSWTWAQFQVGDYMGSGGHINITSLTIEKTPTTKSTCSLAPDEIPDEDEAETASASNWAAEEEKLEPESKPDIASGSDADRAADADPAAETEPETADDSTSDASPAADVDPAADAEPAPDPQKPAALKPADDPQQDEGEPEGEITNEQEKEDV